MIPGPRITIPAGRAEGVTYPALAIDDLRHAVHRIEQAQLATDHETALRLERAAQICRTVMKELE